MSNREIQSLIDSNKILKQHIEFLRVKLKKTENALEMVVNMSEVDNLDKLEKFDITFSVN